MVPGGGGGGGGGLPYSPGGGGGGAEQTFILPRVHRNRVRKGRKEVQGTFTGHTSIREV